MLVISGPIVVSVSETYINAIYFERRGLRWNDAGDDHDKSDPHRRWAHHDHHHYGGMTAELRISLARSTGVIMERRG